jgi:hypothetical protein
VCPWHLAGQQTVQGSKWQISRPALCPTCRHRRSSAIRRVCTQTGNICLKTLHLAFLYKESRNRAPSSEALTAKHTYRCTSSYPLKCFATDRPRHFQLKWPLHKFRSSAQRVVMSRSCLAFPSPKFACLLHRVHLL